MQVEALRKLQLHEEAEKLEQAVNLKFRVDSTSGPGN